MSGIRLSALCAVGLLGLLLGAGCSPAPGPPTPTPTSPAVPPASPTAVIAQPLATPSVPPPTSRPRAPTPMPTVPRPTPTSHPPTPQPPAPTPTLTTTPSSEASPEGPGLLLPIVEENEYWIAYQSPSRHALSMAWADGTLWLADMFTGVFYQVREKESGLEVLRKARVKRDPFMQARDLAWDGESLWSVHWGDILRHDLDASDLAVEVWITEGEMGSPNLHHMKGLAWDGQRFWSILDGTLYRHEERTFVPKEGQQLPRIEATYEVPLSPAGMAFRGSEELWVAGRRYGFIYRINVGSLASGPSEAVSEVYSIVQQPLGLAWSPENLWLYDWSTNRIYKVKRLPQVSLDPEDDYLSGDAYTSPEPLTEGMGEVIWSAEQSPYVIRDGFTVPAGVTLRIEPGVKVYIEKGDFVVRGTLEAVGTPTRMIVFTHRRWQEAWGTLIFQGEEASKSLLKYVKLQYADNGIIFDDAVPRISYSIVRKSGNYGIVVRLREGSYPPLEVVGNRITQLGVGMKLELAPQAEIPSIIIRENEISYAYSTGPIIESTGEDLQTSPDVRVEHNLFRFGYRGVGAGFPGVGNVRFRHNLLEEAISGSGVIVFQPRNEITYNVIRYTFEGAFQLAAARPGLRAMRGPAQTIFKYNTVVAGFFDSNMGDPTTVVEENNLLPDPSWEYWAWGMERASDLVAAMPRNWWGTPDPEEIRSHIIDANLGPDYANDYQELRIEPVLDAPVPVGYIDGVVVDAATGKPLSEAKIRLGGLEVISNVAGEFFLAADAGSVQVEVMATGYLPRTVAIQVSPGELSAPLIELARE